MNDSELRILRAGANLAKRRLDNAKQEEERIRRQLLNAVQARAEAEVEFEQLAEYYEEPKVVWNGGTLWVDSEDTLTPKYNISY
jgi:hypothetical protein